MSTVKKPFSASLFLGLILVFVLSGFAPLPQDPAEVPILEKLGELVAGFLSLAGVAAIVTAIVSFARSRGWVSTDDQAGRLMASLNILGFLILAYFRVFRPDLSLDFLDGIAAQIATILVFLLGLIGQILLPAPLLRLAYQARVPFMQDLGARAEYRAHVIGKDVGTEPGVNWSTDPADPRNKSR